jgi:tetratricopeptide (TPR) repeat protein
VHLLRWIFWGIVSLKAVAVNTTSLPSLSVAADYYFSKNDYSQALSLWEEVYKSQPSSVQAMLKVSELELLLKGHEPSQKTVLDFLNHRRQFISTYDWKNIQSQLELTQSRFVKDESQSLYFQAVSKINLGDFSQALALLNQANILEKGNLLILEAKANCEKRLGFFNKFYETLKTANEIAVVKTRWTESLLEAHYHFKDYGEIVKWFEKRSEQGLTPRQKLTSALALIEKGDEKEGRALLLQIQEKQLAEVIRPMLWYGLGRVLMKEPYSAGMVTKHLERFVASASKLEAFQPQNWDPYRLKEKVAEAQIVLADLKQSP